MIVAYSVRGVLNERQVENLLARLSYSVESMRSCRYASDEVIVEIADDEDKEEITAIIASMVEEVSKVRAFAPRVLKRQQQAESDHGPSFLASSIDQAADGEPYDEEQFKVHLFEAYDALFKAAAMRHAAKVRKYQALIARETMNEMNYIQHFPQNALFVAELPHDYNVLKTIASTESIDQSIQLSRHMLSPAVCFHCYQEFKNRTLYEPIVITAMGSCFRHEAKWRLNEHRLTEFSMREIVFIGASDFVSDLRNRLMEEVWTLFNELGLNGYMTTAHDPFYFPQDARFVQHQLLADMKVELMAEDHLANQYAIASFNSMGDTICREFHITDGRGEPLHSGCAAFGIDRWVHASLAKWGTQLRDYPQVIKQYFAMGHSAPIFS